MVTTNPRLIALQVILQVVEHGRSLEDVIRSGWYRDLNADPRDLALSRELAFGFCRWYFALIPLLQERLDKPLRARDRDIEIILLLGLYQLLVMQTETHAAVNETVELTKSRNKAWASGLVNAVLRNLIRNGVKLDSEAPAQAYPEWMRTRIAEDWGEQAEPVLEAGNARPPMCLRVDTRQCGRSDLLQQLADQGMAATPHVSVDSAILLSTPCDVAELPGFAEGRISVQDAASQLAAVLLDCEPHMRVLDACAAPGGKTAHLLQRYDDLDLDALDSSESRLARLRQNLERIGQSARVLTGDAAHPDDWHPGEAYDRILADVPCSASGVIRRHPDIKLLRRESDIMPLLEQQRQIVDACWRLLKPGGQMLYSTCSIFKDENVSQIADFLERHSDAAEIDLSGENWGIAQTRGRQILTGADHMDGFYYALLSKQGNR